MTPDESMNTTVTESITTPAATGGEGGASPAEGASAAAAAGATEGSPTPGTDGAVADPAAPPAWAARTKYKTRVFGSDEQRENDVPEWAKGLMKDEPTEKELISLFEQAGGIDSIKESRKAVQAERDSFKQRLSHTENAIADVRKTYQRGDIDSFLQKLQIPHDRMLQWALEKVQYSQLPPEQQKLIDERWAAQRSSWDNERNVASAQEQLRDQARNTKQVLLDASLDRPDVKTFSETYDGKRGVPGSFLKEVIAEGELAWTQSNGKVDLTPEQAIKRVMERWNPFLTPAQAQTTGIATGQPAAAAQGQGGGAPAKPTVIPNVQGRSSSPMKSGPRSIDDLRKLSAQASR